LKAKAFSTMSGILYLIPSALGHEKADRFMPLFNQDIIKSLDFFVVENAKPARALLKQAGVPTPFENIHFYEMNKHARQDDFSVVIDRLLDGESVGLITDAGYPATADPGEELIFQAHQKNIRIVPLTGPSSILFALAASGLNAENYTFHAYLPREQSQLVKRLKKLENTVIRENYSQLFIETPYRAQKMFDLIRNTLHGDIYLSICCDLHTDKEFISTRSIAEWRKSRYDLHKRLVVFVIGRCS
jgi:16S rRNA (cytidine1402-2'-O)-methyltransferase